MLCFLRGDPKMKFLRLFLSAVRPSVRPQKTSLDIAPVRHPTSDLGSILYDVYTLGQNTLRQNTNIV